MMCFCAFKRPAESTQHHTTPLHFTPYSQTARLAGGFDVQSEHAPSVTEAKTGASKVAGRTLEITERVRSSTLVDSDGILRARIYPGRYRESQPRLKGSLSVRRLLLVS